MSTNVPEKKRMLPAEEARCGDSASPRCRGAPNCCRRPKPKGSAARWQRSPVRQCEHGQGKSKTCPSSMTLFTPICSNLCIPSAVLNDLAPCLGPCGHHRAAPSRTAGNGNLRDPGAGSVQDEDLTLANTANVLLPPTGVATQVLGVANLLPSIGGGHHKY